MHYVHCSHFSWLTFEIFCSTRFCSNTTAFYPCSVSHLSRQPTIPGLSIYSIFCHRNAYYSISSSKSFSTDVLPTWLLNQHSIFAPIVCHFCNSSDQSGIFPLFLNWLMPPIAQKGHLLMEVTCFLITQFHICLSSP
jgi:hypothetical protein